MYLLATFTRKCLAPNSHAKDVGIFSGLNPLMKIILLALLFISTHLFAYPVTENGRSLSDYLDKLDVDHKWLPGQHVDWLTGEPDNKSGGVTKSHCSAFAAAAMARANVYLLHPPEHSENLLANAQYDWLITQGGQRGWFYVADGFEAQRLSNQGCAVIVAYKNPDSKRPGHVAVIHPSDKSNPELYKEGPDITQAGLNNYQRASLLQGFSHHIQSAQDHTLIYYGHSTEWCDTH